MKASLMDPCTSLLVGAGYPVDFSLNRRGQYARFAALRPHDGETVDSKRVHRPDGTGGQGPGVLAERNVRNEAV